MLTPRQVGTFYLIVTVDPGGSVAELDETNNTTVRVEPLVVLPAYTAIVQTAPTVLPTNTPLLFTGSATRADGTPASYSMVNIHILSGGTERVISAVTNSIGLFTTPWTPLRNEGGLYTIGASHPGSDAAPVQDAFEILTLGFDAPAGVALNEGQSVVTVATLRNPNSRPLNGVTLTVGSTPSGLTITPAVPETILDLGEEMQIPITVTAAAGFSGTGSFVLTVTTTEGVTMQALLNVNVQLLKPVLTLAPDNLNSSVLRGVPKSESFTITNTGGLATGAIQILLPSVPWMTLASADPIPSIPPGGTASISLNLSPDATVPLTLFTGNLALNPANGGSKSVLYRFRVVSDLKGDLEIETVDELYYFTSAAPKLAGAKITVRDAISSEEIATLDTGIDGLASFEALDEGWYRVDVSAPEHDNFTGNYYVHAGEANRQQIFTSKQLVKYTWKVEEVEVQDVCRVTLETTFETKVPAPVVAASPNSIDVGDLLGLGQAKIVNITLENHGFIAAQDTTFRFSDHPFYEFKPLVTNIGTIPAKSSLVVPVTVTRIGVFGDDGEIVTLRNGKRGTRDSVVKNASVPCGAGGTVDFNYPCGLHLVSRALNLIVNGVQGNCGGSSGPSGGGGIYFIGGFYGPGGGGGPSGGSLNFASPDPCTVLCLSRAALDCVVGYAPTPIACAYAVANCAATNGDVLTCVGALFCWAGPIVNTVFCVLSVINCYTNTSGPIGGSSLRDVDPGFVLTPGARTYAPEVATAWQGVETSLSLFELIVGSKERVLMQKEVGMEPMMAHFKLVVAADSSGGSRIDASEITGLQELAASVGLEWMRFAPIVERWNRTVDYYGQGVYDDADVPPGSSHDFIARDVYQFKAQQVLDANTASQGRGYLDPFQEFVAKFGEFRETVEGGQGGACAKVKIQLSQDVMMTRTAFRASLELENERDEVLTDVGFSLKIRDAAGQPAEDLFNVQVTKLSGLASIANDGEIPAKGKGTVVWTLIPRDTAALEQITRYTVGGVIHYVQGASEFNIPVENVPITVRPDASLELKYFHQRDVISDDPHTDVIEPAQPYKLSVLVENKGFGEARNLKIVSGQPQIVDNEKGLFIDFKVIGTEVDGQPLSPSLTADFGNVPPGGRKIATWLMTSTLQGLFTDYKATFKHVTGLGDERISLLKKVEIHEMIRSVKAQGPGEDNAPDFLVNDVPDVNDYPDTIHYSHGGTDLVTLKQAGNFSGAPTPGNLAVTLTVGAFSGWSYIRLPDPAAGAYRLVSVTRADGQLAGRIPTSG